MTRTAIEEAAQNAGDRVRPSAVKRADEPAAKSACEAAAFHHMLRTRRSIRRFLPGAPAPEMLDRLFTSAAGAPSAHNRQPWRFLVVAETATKAALARAMGARLADDRRRDGDDEEAIARDVARSFARLTGAPVLVLICVTLADADVYSDPIRRQAEHVMAIQGTAMAAQNLLLAAHAEGLGACWLCAPLFCPDVVRETLRLPADWLPQGLIALGKPADEGRARPRRPVEAFVVRHGAGWPAT
jgi:coenzyme F420-0:L-glutamate ligase / coenzyme F420-1:gamma-L-glutamate ligase